MVTAARDHWWGSESPQGTFLVPLIKRYFPNYLAELAAEGRELPGFVIKEFEQVTTCGDIKTHHGEFECGKCSHRWKICLRCKRRGWCPACMTYRQINRTGFLQKRVIGDTPIRQYVLTLPPPYRITLAFHPHLVSQVLGQFLKYVFQYLANAAKKVLRAKGIQSVKVHHLRAGAITAIQRFSTDLSLNLHFHCLVTNGVFVKAPTDATAWFLELPAPSTEDVTELATKICRWTCSLLKREGAWEPVHEASATNLDTVAGFVTERDGVKRFYRFCGVASDQETDRPVGRDGIYGFNVYAKESVRRGDRKNLRRLIRYILSPPFTAKQLRPDPESENHVLIDLKRSMLDGTQVLRLTLRQLFDRLVWATPRPNANLLRFHGVYGPNAELRDEVVPEAPLKPEPPADTDETADDFEAWGELNSHTFPEDLRGCPLCGGKPKLITLKTDRIIYRRRSGVPPAEASPSPIIHRRRAA
jgi:hypothetical protein